MKSVTYLGPHDGVISPDTDPPFECGRGEQVDVSDDLAAVLVARENGAQWAYAEVVKPKSAPAADKES